MKTIILNASRNILFAFSLLSIVYSNRSNAFDLQIGDEGVVTFQRDIVLKPYGEVIYTKEFSGDMYFKGKPKDDSCIVELIYIGKDKDSTTQNEIKIKKGTAVEIVVNEARINVQYNPMIHTSEAYYLGKIKDTSLQMISKDQNILIRSNCRDAGLTWAKSPSLKKLLKKSESFYKLAPKILE